VHGLFGHPKNTWTCKDAPASHDIPSGAIVRTGALQDEHQGEALGAAKKSPFTLPLHIRRLAGKSIHGSATPKVSYNHRSVNTRQHSNVSGERGWGKQRCEVFWPRDLLPAVIPYARILTWGYDVQIEQMFTATSQASIFQHATTLLTDLSTLRSRESDRIKPLIFVTHSLGGIVVKDALCISNTEKTFLGEIFPATAGVMFFGTPHRGSKIASVGKIAFEISKLFLQTPNLKILSALEVNSEILDHVGRSFNLLLDQIAFDKGSFFVHSFQEELELKGVMVVDQFSATIDSPLQSTGTIHADHRKWPNSLLLMIPVLIGRLVCFVDGVRKFWSNVEGSPRVEKISCFGTHMEALAQTE
jgi:hypothetical protein